MKELFALPELELIRLEEEDIITTSETDTTEEEEETPVKEPSATDQNDETDETGVTGQQQYVDDVPTAYVK